MRRARRSSTLHHQQLLTGQCLLTNRQGGRDHMPFLAASHKSNQPFFFLFFPFSFVILSFFLAFSLGGGQEFPSNALSIQGPRPVTRVTRAPSGPLDIPKTPLRTRRSAFRAPRVPRGLATHSPPACFHSAVAFLPL